MTQSLRREGDEKLGSAMTGLPQRQGPGRAGRDSSFQKVEGSQTEDEAQQMDGCLVDPGPANLSVLPVLMLTLQGY